MSERWKYQIRIGLFWGLFMSLGMTVFDCFNTSFEEAIVSKYIFLRVLIFVLTGIFWIGYDSWKKKIKRENTPKSTSQSLHLQTKGVLLQHHQE